MARETNILVRYIGYYNVYRNGELHLRRPYNLLDGFENKGTEYPAITLDELKYYSKAEVKERADALLDSIEKCYDFEFINEIFDEMIPKGIICMWSGRNGEIPDGWKLCDGTTYGTTLTPDLRSKFIVGLDPREPSEPADTHNASFPYDTKNYGKTDNTGGDSWVRLKELEQGMMRFAFTRGFAARGTSDGDGVESLTVNNVRMHTWARNPTDVNSGELPSDETSSEVPIPAREAAMPHENRPPYYVLAFIIKI